MTVFKCWCPECEDESAASTIRASTAQDAAAECAEEVWHAAAGQHCERIEIHVRDEAGDVTRWQIYPETQVHFHADPIAGGQS